MVGLDIADAVFEPDSIVIRRQWRSRVGLLLDELQKGPAVLRLSYVADLESKDLVDRRVKALQAQIATAWEEINCCYELVIEPEVYWRRGGPVKQSRGGEQ